MLPAATVRALLNPAFTAAEFTPTQWDSAEDKAKFANALMKFIAHEFPRQSFTRSLYQRLSNMFGHIAHTNLDGFYGASCERDLGKGVFLEQTLSWPQFGDPTFTFSDVERAVKHRLRAAKVIDIFRLLEADATRRRELAMLARQQAKYGARPPPPDLAPIDSQPSTPAPAGRSVCGVTPPGHAEKADAIDDTAGRQAILPSNPERAMLYDRHSNRRGKALPKRKPPRSRSGSGRRRDRRALACPICRVYGANSGAFAERLKVFNPRQCNRASSPSHFPGGEMTRPVHRLTRLNCFTPRNEFQGICATLNEERWAEYAIRGGDDAVAAVKVLRSMPDIDSNRIFLQGYSYGARASLFAVDPKTPGTHDSKIAGVIAYYPYCYDNIEFATPTLVLIGDEDDWTPAKLCEAVKEKPNVEIVVFPGATHAFNMPFKKPVDYLGHHLVHDEKATQEAVKDADAFMDSHMK
jgi:dienelactone hydrolase